MFSLTSTPPDCQEAEEDVVMEEDKAIGCNARPPDPPPDPPTPAPRKASLRMTNPSPNLWSFELESDQEEDDSDPKAPCHQHNLAGCGQCSTEEYIRLAMMRGEISRPEEIYSNPPQYIYDEEELFCKTCFLGGISPRIVSNHREGCPTCPSMTPEQKEAKHGRWWKKQAEMIIKTRFNREQEEKKRR